MAIGVKVVTIDTLVEERVKGLDSMVPEEEVYVPSLRNHILKAFQDNKDARESGGVNRLMLDALRAYNGQYSPEDLGKIKEEGGSDIFMNLTSTKVRAAISWIKDILLASKEDAFSISPTPVVDLPDEVRQKIETLVERDMQRMLDDPEKDSQQTLKEMNERRRDTYQMVLDEINKEASFAFELIELEIKDQMKEGKWEKALSEFIDDFCIFPTAFLKGPIITTKPKLQWEGGKAVVSEEYKLINKRVSPLDIYPAPEATCVNDGNFIEHMRLSRKEISGLLGNGYPYKDSAIRKVLENQEGKGDTLDTNIEDEKAQEELREDTARANENVYHALHFFGSVSRDMLIDWGVPEEKIGDKEDVEIEAILIGSEVIKCAINDDPLGRRPYYAASFQNRPGSIWGSAIPFAMRDIQRMCNACARALANNMGLSSGPIMELNIERLADGQEVEELRPRDIIQTTSDPTGAGGRAVSWQVVPSVANELLAVYDKFSIQADDVTMVPRYSYGNERTGGAAQTASGLSMLLESASKGIKDAIRHIDEDVIIPRVESEFYTYMLKNRARIPFSGDINVIAKGSQTLTMLGAQQMRRNEFLQVTANPIDQELMGPEGRAEILRIIADDLGLGENVIPNRQEIKFAQRKKAEMQQNPPNVQAIQAQNETHAKIAQEKHQLDAAEIQRKARKDETDAQLKIAEMERKRESDAMKISTDLKRDGMKIESDEHKTNQAIALSIQTGDKANNV